MEQLILMSKVVDVVAKFLTPLDNAGEMPLNFNNRLLSGFGHFPPW